MAVAVAACTLPSAGPSTAEMTEGAKTNTTGETRFALIDVNADVVNKMESWTKVSLQGSFRQQGAFATDKIGVGDYVQVVIWEAASGGLFSGPTNTQISGPGSR